MNTTCHACTIDAYSTAVASIAYDTAEGYNITACRTVRAGIEEYTGPNSDRALRRLASLLKKQAIEHFALSFHPPRFFPLDSVFPNTTSGNSFVTHCRAEASYLLNKPGEYMHDHIPYAPSSQDDPVRRHLLLYYPCDPFEEVYENLHSFCSIHSGSHYLRPMILSIAATSQPFILLELEHDYLTCSAGSNGELNYFKFWRLNHTSDAEYFALRELTANPEHREYPVYITGNLSVNTSLTEKISRAAQRDLQAFNLVKLFSMQHSVRSPCCSPVELKALCTALMGLYNQLPS